MKYGITGASGGLGHLVIEHLLKLGVETNAIVALVRSEEKAQEFKAKGLEVRIADYNDANYAEKLQGIDNLLLISSNAIGTRAAEHKKVVQAALKSQVKRIVYTSIANASKVHVPISGEHRQTEEAIKESGLDFTILRNNWYLENYKGDITGAAQHGGVVTAVTNGKVGSVLKTEYAEAAARALISKDYSKKTFELGGPLWSFSEFTETLGSVIGKKLDLNIISIDEKVKMLEGFGIPKAVSEFYASLDSAIDKNLLEVETGELEKILGRTPLSLSEGMKKLLS